MTEPEHGSSMRSAADQSQGLPRALPTEPTPGPQIQAICKPSSMSPPDPAGFVLAPHSQGSTAPFFPFAPRLWLPCQLSPLSTVTQLSLATSGSRTLPGQLWERQERPACLLPAWEPLPKALLGPLGLVSQLAQSWVQKPGWHKTPSQGRAALGGLAHGPPRLPGPSSPSHLL